MCGKQSQKYADVVMNTIFNFNKSKYLSVLYYLAPECAQRLPKLIQ